MTDRVRYGGVDMRFDGDRKRAIEVGRGRLLLTGAVLSAAFVAIGIRLFDVTVLQAGVEPRDPPPAQIARGAAAKTEITDRNGVILAVSLGTAALYANTAWISDADATVNALAKVLPDLDREWAAERLRVPKRYVSLRRHLTPNEQYAILRLGIPGLVLEPDQRRVYPMGRLAAHVVGFSDPDGKGLAGIERQFDTKLREGSGSLSLSIDIRVQHVLRNELSRAMTGIARPARPVSCSTPRTASCSRWCRCPTSIPTGRIPRAPSCASTGRRSASTRWARPSRSSAPRWRWTPAR